MLNLITPPKVLFTVEGYFLIGSRIRMWASLAGGGGAARHYSLHHNADSFSIHHNALNYHTKSVDNGFW